VPTQESLQAFEDWAATNITGDEKGEAQMAMADRED